MTLPAKLHPDFCLTATWHRCLPPPYDERPETYWLARARKGTFVGYTKAGSQKAPAIWRKSQILEWFESNLAEYWPSAINELKAAFATVTPVQPKKKTKVVKS